MDGQSELDGDLFGEPAHKSLYNGMGIVNLRLNASAESLSELIEQMACVRRCTREYHAWVPFVRGALATKEGVHVVEYDRSAGYIFEEIAWGAAAGAAKLSGFFSEWRPAQVLFPLLEKMDLQLCGDPVECLGGGRLGSVFKVRARGEAAAGRPMALKVAVAEGTRQLLREFQLNKRVAKVAPDLIVRATRIDEVSLSGQALKGAGMLMDEVGAPVTAATHAPPAVLREALSVLSALHRAGFLHGSARADNLLFAAPRGPGAGARLKWCDVQRAEEHHLRADDWTDPRRSDSGPLCKLRWDVESLLASFGHEVVVAYIPAAGYVASGFSHEALVDLVEGLGIEVAGA